MHEFIPENISETQLSQLLPIWKNYPILSQKCKKYPKIISLMLDWIRAGVEYKLKKEILNGIKQKFTDSEKSRNEAALSIENLQNNFQDLELKIREYKSDLVKGAKCNPEEKKRFRTELVEKYKMFESYTIVENPRNNSNGINKIVLKSIKSSKNKDLISSKNKEEIKKNEEILNIENSMRNLDSDRIKDLQELNSPESCQAYLEKYIKADLKGIIPSEELEQQLSSERILHRDSSAEFDIESNACEENVSDLPYRIPATYPKSHFIAPPTLTPSQRKPRIFSPGVTKTNSSDRISQPLSISGAKHYANKASTGGISLDPFKQNLTEPLNSDRGQSNVAKLMSYRPTSELGLINEENKHAEKNEIFPYSHATKPGPIRKNSGIQFKSPIFIKPARVTENDTILAQPDMNVFFE